MLVPSLDGNGPLYEQLYRSLRAAILTGRLRPRARLPSTRELAEAAEVSRNTVLAAYQQLFAEGYVSGRVGSGTFVSEELPDRLLAASSCRPPRGSASPPDLQLSRVGSRIDALALGPFLSPTRRGLHIDFRYGAPSARDFPHDLWRKLSARRARAGVERDLDYAHPAGHPELQAAIADYLGRARGVLCEPFQVCVVGGSQQALDLLSRLLIDPGDRVVLEEPHYQGARHAFTSYGAEILSVAVDHDGLDVAGLPRASRIKLAYVTPSHQFPTGGVMPLPRRLELLRWAEERDVWLVEDDYDSEFRYDGRPLPALQGLDRSGRVIYVGTFSKVLFPSLRLGYVVLPEPLRHAFLQAKWLADRHSPTHDQQVLADFLREGHFDRYVRRSRTRNSARREALLEALREQFGDAVEVEGASSGVHLLAWWPEIPIGRLAAVIQTAAAAGIGIYPATPYYLKAPTRTGLLLGYAALTPAQIREGIRRLAKVMVNESALTSVRSAAQ